MAKNQLITVISNMILTSLSILFFADKLLLPHEPNKQQSIVLNQISTLNSVYCPVLSFFQCLKATHTRLSKTIFALGQNPLFHFHYIPSNVFDIIPIKTIDSNCILENLTLLKISP